MTEYEVCQQNTMACEQEIAKGIIGQKDVIRQVMLALLAGGNVLLEGMPGLGKTMLVRTISQVCDLSFQRIQFTPDLMPSDVTGTNIIVKEEQKSAFRFEKGPIFANLVLADEINRATPKTQSALLEAMQEHTVTIGTTSHQLPEPFLVLATQNPIENEGTYPLPEAQLDRFLFKVLVKFPDRQELRGIVELTEGNHPPKIEKVMDRESLLAARACVAQIPIADAVMDYILDLVMATHADNPYIREGASPRAAQALIRTARARAFMENRQKSSQNMAGNRRSVQKGTSAEFSDFREYMPGDDLRRLDWNVYARSERMYIREYFEEKEAVVSVILDTSASMHYGKKSKAELAQDLCAVIAFLTLHHMDRLVLYDSSQMGTPLVVSGGKNALPKVLGWLQARTFSGTETDSFSAVRQMQRRGAGVTVIVSDFLTEAATDPTQDRLEKTMQYLDFTKQRPVLLQTLCAEELRVTMDGTRNLIDMESKEKLRVTMRADVIARYEQELQKLSVRLKKSASAAGGTYILCDSEKERRALILEDLRPLFV